MRDSSLRIGFGDPIRALDAKNAQAGRDGRPSKLLSSNSGETPGRSDGAMAKTTRATLALAKLGVRFALHAYDYDSSADRIGVQAAEALGVAPRRLLKTLMAEVDGKPVCVVVPSDREVSMKKLAAAFAGKAANMMRPADAERLTGYILRRRHQPVRTEKARAGGDRPGGAERDQRVSDWWAARIAD
jgi:hypothetical protein